MEPEKEEDSRQRQLKPYLKYSGMGFQMIAIIIIGAYAGIKLDEYWQNKNPWATIVLMLIAVIASIYLVISSVTKK